MGRIVAVCLSSAKGTAKTPRGSALLVENHGLDGDAHAGPGQRQVSLLPLERIEAFRRAGAAVGFGDFGENLVTEGVDFAALAVGDRLRVGDAVLELTQFGKVCHSRCRIYDTMGDCIMPRHGVFARVSRGGDVRPESRLDVLTASAAAVATANAVAVVVVSDKASRGEREDLSGPAIRDVMSANGFAVGAVRTIPDEKDRIAALLAELCDAESPPALILTTGGTGLSPRDVTPEATLAVVEKLCPGIPEAMRFLSLQVTRRAMLSRAAAGIRGRTLIVNLPGSPRAVRECLGFIVDELRHGLAILRGADSECGSDDIKDRT